MKFLSYYSKDFFQIHIPWGKKISTSILHSCPELPVHFLTVL